MRQIVEEAPRIAGGVRPEYALLLACDGRNNASVADLAQAVGDWEAVARFSAQHAMEARLYACLVSAGANQAVPVTLWENLKSGFQATAARNLRLTAQLLELLDAFSVRGIRVLPYKGPALAQSAYGNLALRHMADLDLLISPRQVQEALHAAAALGYRPLFQLTPRQQSAYLRSECEYDLVSADEFLLDIHWQLTPRHLKIDFDFERAWGRRRPIMLGGREVPALSAEDTALVVAVHGSKHLWERLCWLHDLAACLRVQPLDWDALLARASAQHARNFLLLGLDMAAGTIGADLPASLRMEIGREPEVVAVSRTLQARLLAGSDAMRDAQRWRLLLRLVPDWRHRLQSAARFLFTSGVAEWGSMSLPDRLFPLYALLRLGRIAGKMLGSNSKSDARHNRLPPR